MNNLKRNEKGFGVVEIMLVVVILCAIGAIGWYVHRSLDGINGTYSSAAKTSSGSSPKFSKITKKNTATTANNKAQSTQQYLDIHELGVKLPLTSATSDAYYVLDTGSHLPNGKPNAVWLGLKSLTDPACNPDLNNKGGVGAVGAVWVVAPTDRDPVTNELYTQQDPNGTNIGSYYYFYQGWNTDPSNKCPQTTVMQSANSAFASAAKKMISD